jgi:undecaprenyl-diphosphatase
MGDFFSFSILGLVQGLTEFLPVSSTGHLILVRAFFGISTDYGLAVDAVLQLATALAVIVYFWKDIFALVRLSEKKLLLALIAGTIPAVILGLLLEHTMETVFRSATLVAYALLVGSAVMLAAELVSKKISTSDLTPWKGFVIGLFQSLALVPGMSRSGMTISGGLFLGLSREAAARFGFLLSVPIILGSGAKKLLDLGASGVLSSLGPELLVGGVVAFVSGFAAIHVLLLIVRKYPLYVFIVYRVALAALILILSKNF